MLIKKIIFLLTFLFVFQVLAQDTTESENRKQQIELFIKYLEISRDEQFQLSERKIFSKKAIQISQSLVDSGLLMEALSSNGYILAQEGHYADAFQTFTRIKQISNFAGYHNTADWRRKAYLANVLGLLNKELGEYEEALSQYYQSLSISDSVDWKEGISTALNNISVLYNLHGNTEQAISILKDSWQIALEDSSNNMMFDISINLMDMYVQTRCFDSAYLYGTKALRIANIQNRPYNLAFVEVGFGKLYLTKNNFNSALKSLKKGIEITSINGFDEIRLEALLLLSKTYRHLNEFEAAASALKTADSVDNRINIPILHIKLLIEKSLLKEMVGDYKSAYLYHKEAIFLDDSINRSWETVKYSEIQSLYQIKLQKQRNMVLEKNLSIKQLQVKQQRFFISISIGFLIILSGLVVLFNRKRKFELKTNLLLREQNEKISSQERIIRIKNEQSLQQELDYKNRQLTAFSLSALKQSESLDIVFQEINKLLYQQNIKAATRQKLEEVTRHLRPHNSQKEWEEFRSYFEAVHPSFYNNLKNLVPDLTLNEQKLCAYLKLGMNTKEIASITFRQVRSVESTRFRIRKKLGLTANDNIFVFLNKL